MLDRVARLVNHHPKRILAAGALLIVALAGLGIGAPKVLVGGGFDVPNAPSTRAAELLDQNVEGLANLAFVLESKSGTVDDPADRAAGAEFRQRLSEQERVSNVTDYWTTGAPSLKSKDSGAALVLVRVDGTDSEIEDHVEQIIANAGKDTNEFVVSPGGPMGVNNDINMQVNKDLATAEAIAIPITLILLLIAFRSVIAASLPLLIGITAIFGTLGILFVLGSITDVSIYSMNLTTAMGLGLAVDYALLIVNRFREELRKDVDVETAMTSTIQQAGRTVVFSAATVAVALIALLFFPLFFLRSFAYAGIAVVLLAMTAALFLLPATLRLLGHRVNALRIGRKRDATSDSPFWTRLTRVVMRHPVVTALPVLLLLLVMTIPLFHITFGVPDDRVLSSDVPSRTAGDLLRNEFAGDDTSTTSAVVDGRASDADMTAYVGKLSQVQGVERVDSGLGTFVDGNRAGAVATGGTFDSGDIRYATVVSTLDPVSDEAQDVVRQLRDVSAPTGTTAYVGGQTASIVDIKHSIGSQLPYAAGFIAITTLVLLFLYTGSVLIPIKAVILNLLTMGAVLGAIVWVFQDGNLSGLLNFNASPINIPMPMLLFCIAFGLSMDYEVFVLSRIKEARDAGMSNNDAVVYGLGHTARIITTAAGLLSVTFIAFGMSHVSFLQLFGLGTALAIILDATLVRGVLVPAFMRLAGEANWWAPAPLQKVYARFGLRESN